jgi:hypothetical protein
MTMMVALVGEQPLPNFFPVRHYCPEEILFIYTSRTLHYYQHLLDILQTNTKVYGLEVSPYDIPSIVAKLRAELEKLAPTPSAPPIFNITGGTKPMMIAAYQIAQERSAPTVYLQSEGRQTRVYNYTWENGHIHVKDDKLVPECVTLRDILDLHYGPGKWKQEGTKKDDGGNFERAVADVLRIHGYEVMTNIKALDQIEMDVVVRLGNQYGIIEAKWNKAGKDLKGIRQLITAWRSLGTYVQKFHVITVDQQKQHKEITDALDIRVISLHSYDKTTRTISAADQTQLLESFEKALKG